MTVKEPPPNAAPPPAKAMRIVRKTVAAEAKKHRPPKRVRRAKRKQPVSRALKPLLAAVLRDLPRKPTKAERERIADYCEVAAIEGAKTFARKHLDYGDDIAQDGTLGTAIMLRKKVGRILNLAGQAPANEGKIDSAKDFHVYGGMLWMMLLGRWPGVNSDPRLSI